MRQKYAVVSITHDDDSFIACDMQMQITKNINATKNVVLSPRGVQFITGHCM